jgi:inorganic pyrophosphatase
VVGMNLLDDLEPGPKVPDEIYIVVEIPKGSRHKYEYKDGAFFLDRVLYSSLTPVFDYGIIPQTLTGDGDPLDVLVLVDQPSFPGCVITARPIGILITSDEKGMDDKLIAVPKDDPRYNEIKKIEDLPKHIPKEISFFFSEYKKLEPGKFVKVERFGDVEEAKKIILESIENYKKSKK